MCPQPGCQQVFSSTSALRAHQRVVHAGLRPFACKICSTTFAYRHVLTRHYKCIHPGISPERRPADPPMAVLLEIEAVGLNAEIGDACSPENCAGSRPRECSVEGLGSASVGGCDALDAAPRKKRRKVAADAQASPPALLMQWRSLFNTEVPAGLSVSAECSAPSEETTPPPPPLPHPLAAARQSRQGPRASERGPISSVDEGSKEEWRCADGLVEPKKRRLRLRAPQKPWVEIRQPFFGMQDSSMDKMEMEQLSASQLRMLML